MKKNNLILIWAALFITAICSYAFLPFSTNYGLIINSGFLHLAGLFAVIGGFYVAKQFDLKTYHGQSLFFLALGISFWVFADILYTIFDDILNQPAFPSFIDAIYLLGYPIMGFSLYQYLQQYKIDWSKINLIKFAISTLLLITIAIYVLFFFAYKPGSLVESIINTAYNIGDIFLIILAILTLAIAEQFKNSKLYNITACVTLGFMAAFVGDILYAIFFQAYDTGIQAAKSIDLFYLASYLLFAYAFFDLNSAIKQTQEKIKAIVEKKST